MLAGRLPQCGVLEDASSERSKEACVREVPRRTHLDMCYPWTARARRGNVALAQATCIWLLPGTGTGGYHSGWH